MVYAETKALDRVLRTVTMGNQPRSIRVYMTYMRMCAHRVDGKSSYIVKMKVYSDCHRKMMGINSDAMHVHFIKEMGEVPKYATMHPAAVLLGSRIGISSDVCITNQAVMGLNGWLNSQSQFR